MAKYSKLLLQNGGGIKSTEQMVPLAPNTAAIFIGLGGTGIDCLRKIKTEVEQRIYPEDSDAVTYQNRHIRFLGVDSVYYQKKNHEDGLADLKENEFFSLANADLKEYFKNPLVIEARPDLQWLEHEKITIFDDVKGSGGIRQIGRLLFMDKADLFIEKLEYEIQAAKKWLMNPHVSIYIITGLCGGTGSGCFLDVCYLTRHVENLLGGGLVQGCIFLPDVNVARIPEESSLVRDVLYRNSYAAMQELDYCMGLPQNGDTFEQSYKNGRTVRWDRPPMDVCYLLGANGELGGMIRDGYHHAISIASEFMVQMITTMSDIQMVSNISAIVQSASARKNTGAQMKYCAIGGASISLPCREIETYTASKLMEKFSCIKQNVPTKEEVGVLAKSIFDAENESIKDVYAALLKKLKKDVSDDFTTFPDDWKFVLEYGNAGFVKHYEEQLRLKEKQIEKNVKALSDKDETTSLFNRSKAILAEILCDMKRGPFYVEKVVSSAENDNLLCFIDGLILENNERWNQERVQSELRHKDYTVAYNDFDNRTKRNLFDTDQKRFENYAKSLVLLEQHHLNLFAYKQMNEVLVHIREQMKWEAWNYYHKISRIVWNLLESFAANTEYMQSQSFTYDTFVRPVVTVEEIACSLNQSVDEMNHSGIFSYFMETFMRSEEWWKDEDENKICKQVNSFFIDCVRPLEISLDQVLREKYTREYGSISDPQISRMVYDEWVKPLAGRAKPFMNFDPAVINEHDVTKFETITCGYPASIVGDAVMELCRYDNWQQPNMEGRIGYVSVVTIAVGFPLAGYINCKNAEIRKYAQEMPGQHIYERDGVNGRVFSDWRNLPPVTPQCFIDVECAQPKLREWLLEKKALFQKAKALNLIDEESFVCRPTEESVKRFESVFAEYEEELRQMEIPAQMRYCDKIIALLQDAMKLETERTELQLPTDGQWLNPEGHLRFQEDYFVASPVIQHEVKCTIEAMNALFHEAETLITRLEEKMQIFRV